jgi:hypothetical protein
VAKVIKLSNGLIEDAIKQGKAQNRSPSQQIEYWARLGKIAEKNPELSFGFIKDIWIGLAEYEENDVSTYQFG